MTKAEKDISFNKACTFEKIAPGSFGYNYYEILNIELFSDYSEKRKQDLNNHFRVISNPRKQNAIDCLDHIHRLFDKKGKKRIYTDALKVKFEDELKQIIKNFVRKDKELDLEEESIVKEEGNERGFSHSDIQRIIKEQQDVLGFGTTGKQPNKSSAESSTATKAGYPAMDILFNGKVYETEKNEKLPDFIFDNVKLSETRREIIKIKNGGGGTLDATAVFSAKWIEVI
ncbi:hypothetical protein JYU05_00275, partial [bacterium AH-315-P13]|nr:hypothetical protein [bacterium AH-315-P13]